MSEKKEEKQVEVELNITPDSIAKPANHFIVSFSDEDFSLDIIYINPCDIHMASTKGIKKVKGEIMARIAMNYRNVIKLRDSLTEMINAYGSKKNE
jgi:hypothetical protein